MTEKENLPEDLLSKDKLFGLTIDRRLSEIRYEHFPKQICDYGEL